MAITKKICSHTYRKVVIDLQNSIGLHRLGQRHAQQSYDSESSSAHPQRAEKGVQETNNPLVLNVADRVPSGQV